MQVVPYIGARAKNALRFLWRRLHGYNGEFWQDRWVIRDVLRGKRGGFFVDVGAHDGYIGSNTYVLERRYGWKGICMEPNSRSVRRLRACRDCTCVEACAAASDGYADFLEAGAWGGIAACYSPKGMSLLRRYVRWKKLYVDGKLNTVRKPTFSLASVLHAHGAPRIIDYLSMDTEGSELEILRDFPFTDYTFLCMTVEHNSQPQARTALRELLERNGYRLAKEGSVDDFYVHPLAEEQGQKSL